ncbi:class I SAM-dependent RNA methyltransferase [Deinococcus cellulosilyticus]|uniref:RNA methyltransferase n=1 Tax=Deinococcus cellulosilyticus (strain DSM 18568 / NBRC 106333 / KACC 11606 / 5516J-15) TaxID=1223518 RepID=A0A511MZ76_DEIC1|nr:methyltransferase domain-containing protein [Deinococcus cellulosilyticus]GEM45447.1 RNA methyltransferase [Deinococcus cellulosilyticus NBRC 106333 = KACC 11606]
MIVKVEKIIAGGLGLARHESGVVLVEGGLPGEVLDVQVVQEKPVRTAHIVSIQEESPDRTDRLDAPPTLNLAHATYEAQLKYKQGIVQDALTRIGKLPFEVSSTQASPSQWHYRTVAQYGIDSGRFFYRERGSHEKRTLRADPIAHDRIDVLLRAVDPGKLGGAYEVVFRTSILTGETLAALIGEGNPQDYQKPALYLADLGIHGVSHARPGKYRFQHGAKLVWGEPVTLEQYGRFALSVMVSSFAQVNPEAASELFLKAAELAGAGETALDLYGGSGALGLHLAANYGKVTVLDINQESLDRGRKDAERLNIKNIRFQRGDARRMNLAYGTITLDPPRAGLTPEVIEMLGRSQADTLVYVSCDPATWARDVKQLSGWGFKLQEAIPWDFYPHTSHVEVLSLLQR